jgi:hypothetical protein
MPAPTVSWLTRDGGILAFDGAIAIYAGGNSCCCPVKCCDRDNPIGPTPRHMPTVLHARITGTCVPCEGAEFDLTWNPTTLSWEWSATAPSSCSLLDTGTSWRFDCLEVTDNCDNPLVPQFRLCGTGSVCVFGFSAGETGCAYNDPGCSCNPIHAFFQFPDVGGVGCCGSGLEDFDGSFTVEVWE